jgi:hypothetical protein
MHVGDGPKFIVSALDESANTSAVGAATTTAATDDSGDCGKV